MIWWQEGGVWMYIVLAVLMMALLGGSVSVALALGAFLAPILKIVSRLLALVLLLLALLLPTGMGALGWQVGRYQVDQALQFVDEEQRARIEEVGYAEARRPLEFGLGSSLCAMMPPVLALLLSLAAPGPKRDEDE